jgi:hypothetical protein
MSNSRRIENIETIVVIVVVIGSWRILADDDG